MNKTKGEKKAKPGPKADRLKLDTGWLEAIKRSFRGPPKDTDDDVAGGVDEPDVSDDEGDIGSETKPK